MIGRGIFGKPWLFEGIPKMKTDADGFDRGRGKSSMALSQSVKKVDTLKKSPEKTAVEHLKILLEHTKLFEKTYCKILAGGKNKKRLKNFAVMKKHFKAYVSGWDGAKELRVKLMETDSYKEVKKSIDEYLAL
jgi:tRNA-dihydrouridine synthase